MQKFRTGDAWWGFDPERGWLLWDASLNDWMPQADGPFPWAKSPFTRRTKRRLSKRAAAMESLVPANRDEARLLSYVLSEPAPPEDDPPQVAVALGALIPQTKEERRMLAHVASRHDPRPPLVVRDEPRRYGTFLWTMRAIGIAGGLVLAGFVAWLAIGLLDALFLPW